MKGAYVALGSSMAASLPRLVRRLPVLGTRLRELLDPAARDGALQDDALGQVAAGAASVDHHPWSPEPWTVGAGFPLSFLAGKPAPFHPNAGGMRAVADLVIGLNCQDGG